VVTGASDGIGKEYAVQLARKGFNLVLVSRTQSKLDALASQIKTSSSSTAVETLSIDFSKASDGDYTALAKLVENKQVAVLINNVGQSHNIPVSFAETPLTEMTNIININCTGTLRVTQAVLPSMIPHKKGLVLTMGSFGGLTPTPLLATYSGSKAFLQYWSNALASELAPQGITVHFIHSYLVTSAMSKIRRANWQVPSEKAFVKSALSKIGRRGGSIGYPHSGTPYWSHAIAGAIIIGIVGPMSSALLEYNRKMHVAIRKRALKKAEKAKKTI
jgi:17beta-estradiol 17-dehydrogenase / very-long-chain 3-oxoacyl-CoA reductase